MKIRMSVSAKAVCVCVCVCVCARVCVEREGEKLDFKELAPVIMKA